MVPSPCCPIYPVSNFVNNDRYQKFPLMKIGAINNADEYGGGSVQLSRPCLLLLSSSHSPSGDYQQSPRTCVRIVHKLQLKKPLHCCYLKGPGISQRMQNWQWMRNKQFTTLNGLTAWSEGGYGCGFKSNKLWKETICNSCSSILKGRKL